MPRPIKCRRVCRMPIVDEFNVSGEGSSEYTVLTVDEYECIRLIDYRGFSQEECAEYMRVSRATVQLICDNAHRKLASALVNGTGIRISGGEYTLCDGNEDARLCGGCDKHCGNRRIED